MSRQRSKLFTGSPGPIDYITIDQSYTKSATEVLVTGDVNGAQIQKIRAGSHRYLAKHTGTQQMTVCQLLDSNSNYFHDGSAATLTGAMGDVMMRPPLFHWKVFDAETDVVTTGFTTKDKPDETWHTWNPGQLLGVYHAYLSDSKLYSRSGVTPTGNMTHVNARTYARARGVGFHDVTWEWHNMMIVLYLAKYGIMNSQETCGYGAFGQGRTTGGASAMGMTDTTKATGAKDVNFWGIENWWSNMLDYVDNVSIDDGVITVTDPVDGTSRTVSTTASTANSRIYSKRIITENLDIFAGASQSGGSETTGWCDLYLGVSGSRVVMRGGRNAQPFNGIAYTYAALNSSDPYDERSTRLAFTGEVIVEEDPERFKSLTAIS